MKRIFYLILSICLLGMTPARALAWSEDGHYVIAYIAEKRLTPKVRQEVKKLLGAETAFVSESIWADMQRIFEPQTRKWHFVAIPKSATSYDPQRDCRDQCLIERIEHFLGVMKKKDETPKARAEALKYLIHFVGDIHQPLHCTDDNDGGGNRLKVLFFGRPTNLHKVWDFDLLEEAGMDVKSYAEKLEARASDVNDSGTPVDWANESHRLATVFAYVYPPGGELGSTYYQSNLPVAEDQLLKAGVRLARLLNNSF